MGIVDDVSKVVMRHTDAVKATAIGGGLTACAVGYSAYEMVAQYVGYADAPLFCATAACGLPLAGTAVTLWGARRRRAGLPVFPMIDRIRREIYGPAVPPVTPTPDVPNTPGEQPIITDPVDMLANSLHLLLVGYTGGGKTTLMHALAMHLTRQGRAVIVMDPDAANGLWPGCTVVGAGDNFDQMNDVILRLSQEVSYRRDLRAQGQREFEQVYVVIDEYADVHKNCPDAREFVEGLLRRGRKLGIHLFLGVQDRLVKTMGFEGQGELRRNFTYVVDVMKDQATGARTWRLEQNNDRQNAMTILAPRLPNLDHLIIPVNIDGSQGSVTERLGIENGRLAPSAELPTRPYLRTPTAAPTPKLAFPVPVPGRGGGGDFSPETAVSRPKTAENGANSAIGNENPFPAGTQQERPIKPLPSEMVVKFMEMRFAAHPDFVNPPPSLEQDKVTAIALCLHAGMSQNATMRAIYGAAGGRYRDYVRLVDKHLFVLRRGWLERQRQLV